MCGIAGFSFTQDCRIDPWQAVRVLLASVAERGADAAGCVYEDSTHGLVVEKQPGGASKFLETVRVPSHARQMLLHVRDFTKGRPSLLANNHPIRHGSVVGVHNGKIANDDALFEQHGRERFEPGMTVDSEAIFMSLDVRGSDDVGALEQLRGAIATCWFDERRPGSMFLARGYGRPLWIARTMRRDAVLWASTLEALEIVEDFLGVRLHKRPVRPGNILEVRDGAVVDQRTYVADASAQWLANPVASPDEKRIALERLDAVRDELRVEDGARIA